MPDGKPVYPRGNLSVLPSGKVTNGRFTAKRVAEALWECKGLVTLAAQRLGCKPEVVRGYVKRFPMVAMATHDAREELVDHAELSLRKAVHDGEPWAVTLVLRTLGKDRGYVERQESTVEAHIVTGTIAEWEQRLQAAHTALESRRQKAMEAEYKDVTHADDSPAS